jgi:hypothetical protein
LPSSFTRVLSSAWGFSPCPPVSVSGTVLQHLKLRGFSWKRGINRFARTRARHRVSALNERADLPTRSAYPLEPGHPTPGRPSLLRPPIATLQGTGILARLPSTTPFGLALGADSPCADERCAGTLGLSARGIFTPLIVTHVSIRTSDTSSRPPGRPSPAYGTLPYHMTPKGHIRSFGIPLRAPLHLPRRPTRPVSYYAFFKGWLLLSQPPGCLRLPTSFPTER